MLLALPVPTLISLQTPWRTKLRLFTICALGLFIIAITIIRLPINALHATVQANRTTWASTELLAAAIAVNAPVLYGGINHWQRRSKNETNGSNSRPGIFKNSYLARSSEGRTDFHDDEGPILNTNCESGVTSEAALKSIRFKKDS